MVNSNFGYSTVSYTMFNLMKQLEISPLKRKKVLSEWLASEPEGLDGLELQPYKAQPETHPVLQPG